jgi:hypothetical protein
MAHTRSWQIEVQLTEDGEQTRAVATLTTDAGAELRHVGQARRAPSDPDVPAIGDELATCRALQALAQDLLERSVSDVEANMKRVRG